MCNDQKSEIENISKEYKEKSLVIRSLINDENKMYNDRMYWLVLIEGLLFASMGALIHDNNVSNVIQYLTILFLTGLCVSISFIYIFRLSEKAMDRLKDKHREICTDLKISEKEEDFVIGINHKEGCPNPFHFLAPWNFLPYVFGIAWLLLLLFTFFSCNLKNG